MTKDTIKTTVKLNLKKKLKKQYSFFSAKLNALANVEDV